MPIHAIAVRGPIEKPNERVLVEIIDQIQSQPHGRWKCRVVGTGEELEFFHANLNLFWLEDVAPK